MSKTLLHGNLEIGVEICFTSTLPTKYFMWHKLCLSTSFLYHLGPPFLKIGVTVFLYISWNYLLSYHFSPPCGVALHFRSINLRETKRQRAKRHSNTHQNDLCPTRSWQHVNSSLVIMGYSFWILLGKYHHISMWLLSSVNPPGYFWRNSHQSF